jgi:hypothetical protein
MIYCNHLPSINRWIAGRILKEVIRMTDGLTCLLANNAEISQYYSSLPQTVKDAVICSAEDIYSVEDLLKCIQDVTGSCQS